MFRALFFCLLPFLSACLSKENKSQLAKTERQVIAEPVASLVPQYDTTLWTELTQLDSTIRLDIRYATDNNFVGEKMYDCGKCFLRPEAAERIAKAHAILRKSGFGLLMFDCYRPRPFQQRLWDKVPDARYVTPPSKGSMHNRGLAVDLTIVDNEGKPLEMGTEYDFFGERAYQSFTDLDHTVLENRKLLNETMDEVGFKPIRTEWWHFSLRGFDYEISDMVWPCP